MAVGVLTQVSAVTKCVAIFLAVGQEVGRTARWGLVIYCIVSKQWADGHLQRRGEQTPLLQAQEGAIGKWNFRSML